MTAPNVTLNVDQGAQYEVTFTYCNPSESAPTQPGTPIDVTGWTALMQFRERPGTPVILELTDAAGITVGTTDGTFVVTMTPEQTDVFNGSCKYDLLISPPDDVPIRLVEGTMYPDPAISVPDA